MSDLSKNTPREYKLTGVQKLVNLPLAASTTIYEGAYVSTDASGDAVNGDQTQTKNIGICLAKASTTDSDTSVDVILESVTKLTITGATDDSDIGSYVYLGSDDNSFTLNSTGNDSIGVVQEWVSGEVCWVFLQSDTLRV